MKLPGVPLCYAAIMALFGEHAAGIRLGLAIVNAATSGLLYLIGRDVISRWAGVVAAAAYSVLSLTHVLHGIIANAEHFALLPALGGTWLLVRKMPARRRDIALAGLCFGLAVFAKQQAAALAAFGLSWLVWQAIAEQRPARIAPDAATFLAGPIGLYGLFCLWAWRAGVFETMWLWTVTYPRSYVSQVSAPIAFEQLLGAGVPIVVFTGPALLLSVLGLIGAVRRSFRRVGSFLALLGVFGCLAVAPGGHFREHYFLWLLPAVCLAFGTCADQWTRAGINLRRRLLVAGVLGASLAWTLWCDRDVLFRLSPAEVSRRMYGDSPFAESPAIGEHIRRTTPATATIAVLGSEPQIPFYARRRSASGFLYLYPLVEPHPHAEAMQRQFAAEVEAASPDIVVIVRTPTSWLVRPGAPQYVFEWMATYIVSHYALEATIDVDHSGRAEVVTGEAARERADANPLAVRLMRRKQ
jgi:4-amino-4-deoxy-L-arabinose transferase-like glycosyltransferase